MKLHRYYSLKVLAILFIGVSINTQVFGSVILDDGGIHTISSASPDVIVRDSGGALSTTLRVVAGADIAGNASDTSIAVFDTSIVRIFAGIVQQDVEVFDFGKAFVSGGTLDDDFYLYGSAQAEITGGNLSDDFEASDDSHAKVSGGTFGNDFETYDDSTATISGGTIEDDVEASDNSKITIQGGMFKEDIEAFDVSEIIISGGIFASASYDVGFGAFDGGTIRIFGSNFAVDGSSVGPGGLVPLSGTLTGILQDGSSLDIPFAQDESQQIILELTTVPEPATVVIWAGLGIGGGLVVRRRRRR